MFHNPILYCMMNMSPIYILYVKHCLDFSFVFSASGVFCSGMYQPGCTGIFWPVEGTSQPVTISKKWKNPSSALCRKRTWVQALSRVSTCSLGLLAWGTDLKSWKGLMGCGSEHQSCPYKVTFQRLNIVAIAATHLRPEKWEKTLSDRGLSWLAWNTLPPWQKVEDQ